MKLIGTVLRCSTRKVHSSGKETYVTNLLVLDRENSGGTNYAVEAWDDKPHQLTLISDIALTVTGVVNKSGGVPALRAVMAAQPPRPAGAEAPAAETPAAALAVAAATGRKEGAESSTRFGARARDETTPFTIPFTTHPWGWLLRVGLEGG